MMSTRTRGRDMRMLPRSRAVQVLLAATAVIQALAVAGGPRTPDRPRPAVQPTAAAAPAPEVSGSDTAAVVALALAEKYREKGYSVPDTLAARIVSAAAAHGVAPEVAFGLVATESEFKRTALSPVGAIGLAQVMPATARLIEPGTTREDLRNPETNLRLGFRHLRDLLEKYGGDTELALTAYNRGPGTVDRVLARGGDPDNGYAAKVLGEG